MPIKAAQTTLRQCMALKKHETLLIIYDRSKKRIADALFNAGKKICRHALKVEVPAAKVNGEEPPESVAQMMKEFDVIVGITAKSLTHTMAVKDSLKNARVATMPGMTLGLFRRSMAVDYSKIAERTTRLKKELNKCRKIRITTKRGTDITLGMGKKMNIRKKEGFIHKKGHLNNLPAGEAGFAPRHGSAKGVFIVDASMAGAGKLDKPIKITVKKGYAVNIEGGKAAARLRGIIKSCGKNADNIAELGIGTNHHARISGCVLEDEKVMGTAHIALGNSKGMGGSIYAKCHIDGVFHKPTIYADGKIIIREGKFLI